MAIVSIRQPGYLPYMGFFKKIQTSDVFVYLDDTQYERSDWDNRNYIRTSQGSIVLTVPAFNKFGQKLNEVKIVNKENWSKKHVASIKLNYQKAPYFEKYWDNIEELLSKKWEKLIELNLALIKYFNSKLDLKSRTIKSSELDVKLTSSERLLEICKKLDAKTYLSGSMGKNYLDEKIFHDAGIDVVYENFVHPVYKQIHGDFIPNMAIIDLLFNEGENSKEIMSKSQNM